MTRCTVTVVKEVYGRRTNSAISMVRTRTPQTKLGTVYCGNTLVLRSCTAAMPSLHFGYSLLIGLTIISIPIRTHQQQWKTFSIFGSRIHVSIPNVRRTTCILAGTLYPLIILIAIVATANHFILDAVAGAMVCGLAWSYNHVLLNLLPLEDWFLCAIRVHFPERGVTNAD